MELSGLSPDDLEGLWRTGSVEQERIAIEQLILEACNDHEASRPKAVRPSNKP